MAIIAKINGGIRLKKEEIIKICEKAGISFIELVYNEKGINPIKMSGFDDVIVTISPEHTPRLEYNKFGSAKFEPTVWGKRVALVPRTARNLRVLASSFRDGLYTITDTASRKQVEELAMQVPVTQKELDRRNRAKTSPIDNQPLKDKNIGNQVLKDSLEDENIALKQKVKNLESDSTENLETPPIAPEFETKGPYQPDMVDPDKSLSINPVQKDAQSPQQPETQDVPANYEDLKLPELLKTAKERNLSLKRGMSKQDVIAMLKQSEAQSVPVGGAEIA